MPVCVVKSGAPTVWAVHAVWKHEALDTLVTAGPRPVAMAVIIIAPTHASTCAHHTANHSTNPLHKSLVQTLFTYLEAVYTYYW